MVPIRLPGRRFLIFQLLHIQHIHANRSAQRHNITSGDSPKTYKKRIRKDCGLSNCFREVSGGFVIKARNTGHLCADIKVAFPDEIYP